MPVIDTHVHNADVSKFSYTFPKSFPSLNKSWSLQEYRNASAGTTIRGVVLMEAAHRLSHCW